MRCWRQLRGPMLASAAELLWKALLPWRPFCKSFMAHGMLSSHVHLPPALVLPPCNFDQWWQRSCGCDHGRAHKGWKQTHLLTSPSCIQPILLLQESPAALSTPQAAHNNFWALSESLESTCTITGCFCKQIYTQSCVFLYLTSGLSANTANLGSHCIGEGNWNLSTLS